MQKVSRALTTLTVPAFLASSADAQKPKPPVAPKAPTKPISTTAPATGIVLIICQDFRCRDIQITHEEVVIKDASGATRKI